MLLFFVICENDDCYPIHSYLLLRYLVNTFLIISEYVGYAKIVSDTCSALTLFFIINIINWIHSPAWAPIASAPRAWSFSLNTTLIKPPVLRSVWMQFSGQPYEQKSQLLIQQIQLQLRLNRIVSLENNFKF